MLQSDYAEPFESCLVTWKTVWSAAIEQASTFSHLERVAVAEMFMEERELQDSRLKRGDRPLCRHVSRVRPSRPLEEYGE
jgi:hypothetical protein